jgi:ribosomal-protein-serine acetyltransferase
VGGQGPIEVRAGLGLEPMHPDLAAEYFAVVDRNLARLARWEPWATTPQTVSSVRVYLAWQAQACTSGTALPFVVRLDGTIIGSCSARIDTTDGNAEIGYWVDARVEGSGVAAESIGALVTHLFTSAGVGRIQARTAVDNVRSRALLERLGFEFEGVQRSAQRFADRRVDMAVYARIAAG